MAGERKSSEKRESSRSHRDKAVKSDKKRDEKKEVREKSQKDHCEKSCEKPCHPPSCEKPSCEKPSCETPCPPSCEKPSCEKDMAKWCDFKNVCSMFSGCLPKGLWCDTMSCLIPCDKVYKITDNVKVRVNLYCNPFNDVVTVNGVPVLGCLEIPDLCKTNLIDLLASNTCALACPVTLNIYEKLRTYPDLSYLVQAIDKVGGDVKLYLENKCTAATLFAPNNEAFEALAAAYGITVPQLLDNPNLNEILLNHVVAKVYFSAAFRQGQTNKVLALSKECLEVCKNKNGVFVSSELTTNAKVLEADILATNGVIHIIDKVLEPVIL
jgi:uncharacterized surface protein with fasciclin (FAS1) repeats